MGGGGVLFIASRLRATWQTPIRRKPIITAVIIKPPQKTYRFNFRDTKPFEFHTSQTSHNLPNQDTYLYPDPPTQRHGDQQYSSNPGRHSLEIQKTASSPGSSYRMGPLQAKRLNPYPDLTEQGGKRKKFYPYPNLTGRGANTKILPLPGSTRTGGKNKNSTLLPHIENLYKGVGGK